MSDVPVQEDYEDADEWMFAQEEYEQEIKELQELRMDLEKMISAGMMLKLAILGTTTIKVYYDEVRVQTTQANGAINGNEPIDPARNLKDKDTRNNSICYEHITKIPEVESQDRPEEEPQIVNDP